MSDYTHSQRSLVSAQWSFDAAIKMFEAASVVHNQEALEYARKQCHEKLDVLLTAKERAFSEFIDPSNTQH